LWYEKDIEEYEDPPTTEDEEGWQPKVIELEDGSLLTIDAYGQSGNVLVGYGYITNPNGHPRFQVVFVVILFNEDGGIEEKGIWKENKIDPNMSDKKRDAFIRLMLDVVGDENDQDLVNAIDIFRERAFVLGDAKVGKIVMEGAAAGAAAGAFGGPPGLTAGAIIGAIAGGLSALLAVAEQDKWHEIENFLSDLIGSSLLPKPT
jgi:hypothetical protein